MTNIGAVRVWQPAGQPTGDFLCTYFESGADAAHLHEEWQFAVAEFPSLVSIGAFRRYSAGVDDVAVVAPFEVHAERQTVGPAGWRVLHVAAPIVARLYREIANTDGSWRPTFASPVLQDPAAAAELRTLLRQSEARECTDAFAPRLLEWLSGFLRRHAEPGVSAPVHSVERARAYLRERPNQTINLPDMIAAAGVSGPHLVRSFSRQVGLPPRSYHAQVRLARARRLLAQGHSATRVAYECGFADQSHLNRRFKECYGLTPGAFQAQYFAGQTGTNADVAPTAAVPQAPPPGALDPLRHRCA